jgi:hypothetical protein
VKVASILKVGGERKEEKEKTKNAGRLCKCLADDDPYAWCPELKNSDSFLRKKIRQSLFQK